METGAAYDLDIGAGTAVDSDMGACEATDFDMGTGAAEDSMCNLCHQVWSYCQFVFVEKTMNFVESSGEAQ